MNDYGRRYLIEKLGRHGDDYADGRDYEDNRDYEDERRGMKNSNRRRRSNRDYEDTEDYHKKKEMRLTKSEKNRWKRELENTDGTRGEHFDMQQVLGAAEKLGIRFNEYTEKDFCLVTNIMYSDYGHIIKKLVGPDKELMVCADMAKAYFDDPDSVEPEEKLAVHYCMMDFG